MFAHGHCKLPRNHIEGDHFWKVRGSCQLRTRGQRKALRSPTAAVPAKALRDAGVHAANLQYAAAADSHQPDNANYDYDDDLVSDDHAVGPANGLAVAIPHPLSIAGANCKTFF